MNTTTDSRTWEDLEGKTHILEPGEKVIFKFDWRLSPEEANYFSDIIKAKLGDDFPFLVIGEGVDVTVYREQA